MAMGKRTDKQAELWVPTQAVPKSPGHPFYQKLNELLAGADFDNFVQNMCRPFYAEVLGRPSIPPGVYFRMLFVGYFEGLDSQRGIAWRCQDSRSLQDFLGYLPTEPTPDHSSLTKVRERLPEVVHEEVFAFVLKLATDHGLSGGKTVAVDSTMLEANAAMKSLTRRDNGDDYKTYLKKLAKEAGLENPTDEDLRRFDKKRSGKKMSNKEWESPTDPDSRITKMKDGTTHLAYKAEHVVDLKSNLVLAAEIHRPDQADSATLERSMQTAQRNLIRAGSEQDIEEAVADKGYHKMTLLARCAASGIRTYIPEPQTEGHVWTDKPPEQERAYRANRRRVHGARSKRSKRLQKLRSEFVELTFAHVCETGGARRSWLCGLDRVSKRYLLQVAAHNLGLVMRKVFGIGKPRVLQDAKAACAAFFAWIWALAHTYGSAIAGSTNPKTARASWCQAA